MIWEIHEEEERVEGLDAAGRPDPAYAAVLGLLPAPLGRRALAAVCDGVFWLLLQLPLWIGTVPLLLKLAAGSISPYGFLNHPGFVLAVVTAAITTFLTLAFVVVQLVLHGRRGVTIGKAVAGIRTVDVRTLERPGVAKVLLRFLLVAAAGVVPVIGPVLFLVSPAFDPERRGRGWHDQATKIWLVDVRRGLHPYDEKRMRVARKVVKAEPAPERPALPSLATQTDPSAPPEYRPAGRLSAGVLGVARPHRANERPGAGFPPTSAPAPLPPAEEGKPVLGGYRPAGEQLPAAQTAGEASAAAPFAPAPVPRAAAAPVPQAPAPVPQAVQAVVPPVVASPSPALPAPAAGPSVPPASPSAPVPPATPPAPAGAPGQRAEPAARFGLQLDSGDSILISAPVLLGRNPEAAQSPGARPIALADESRSLSKTHLLVRPVEGGLEVMDCRSTNGSGLIRDGVEYALAAGTPVLTTDGDTIRIGDRTAAVVRV